MDTVDLYWIPLGAGGHCVRFNGRVYEAIKAGCASAALQLYHSAVVVELSGERYTIEVAPSPDGSGDRGVVGTGAVGSRRLGRLRCSDEVRCWRGGSIPISAMPPTARRLTGDERRPPAARPRRRRPSAGLGGDELHAGESGTRTR